MKNQDNIVFHDPENHHCLTLDLGSKDSESAIRYFETETQAENRRLLYVALTRASAMCSIIWCPVKNIQMSALAQMLHPDGCSEDESMICDIDDLKSRCPASISCNFYEDEVFETKDCNQDQLLPALIEPEPVTRNMNAQWRISSFSGLTKSSHPGIDLSENTPSDAGLKITLADFPKGPRAGDLFHAVFEAMDFTKHADKNQADIQAVFDTFGYTDPQLLQIGVTAINQVMETQLTSNETRFCLKQVQNHERLTEMEFIFSVKSFNIAWIKTALESSHPEGGASGYINTLSQLNISDFRGFLKGFIDLVICHNGKWYILDYKSNYLGNTYDMYAKDRLFEAMREHHYILQYHIYLAALDQYLKLRLKNYDYDTHFGGIFYLFIRGMHPEYASKYGVFFDRPPQKAMQVWSDNLF